jgi:putative hydrolase of the HAD superfamily
VQRFERGDLETEEFARRITEDFDLPLSPEEFVTHFVEWARGPYPGAVELLRRIGQTHRVAALSNSNRLHTARHRRHIEDVIDVFYFSDEIGFVKPEREIFDHVILDLAVPPHRIAFFDDTTINVEAAHDVGLAAYRVDGFEALKARLQSLGLIESS